MIKLTIVETFSSNWSNVRIISSMKDNDVYFRVTEYDDSQRKEIKENESN